MPVRTAIVGLLFFAATVAAADGPNGDAGPAPSHAELAKADLLAWATPVNGLTGRIESAVTDLSESPGYSKGLFVRLRNVGTVPLTVPAEPATVGGADIFELYLALEGRWRRDPYQLVRLADAEDRASRGEAPKEDDRRTVTLAPGESVLCLPNGDVPDNADAIRIVLSRPAGKGTDWTGRLVLPPYPVRVSAKRVTPPGSLPCPEHLPEFDSDIATVPLGNRFTTPGKVEAYLDLNHALIRQLSLYKPAEVARHLERQVAAAPRGWWTTSRQRAFVVFLLTLAAEAGSDAGRKALLAHLARTDASVQSRLDVLYYLLRARSAEMLADAPDWVLDAALHTVADTQDSYLILSLGGMNCRRAVPILIGMIKDPKRPLAAISALGSLGDPQAIPVLMEIAEANASEVTISVGSLSPDDFRYSVCALGSLKAKEAVPFLLRFAGHEDVIAALEEIGDPAALPILRAVAAGKPKRIPGADSETDARCIAEAKIALAVLEPGDAVPRLCALLTDMSLDEYKRWQVVRRLALRRDPRAVPHLVKAAKSDPSGGIVDLAIGALSEIRTKDAVAGLIECFDADFAGKHNWKFAGMPEHFRSHIARSLRAITGETFGPDKRAWADWWETVGRRDPAFN